jgi:hypothetical protein
VGAHLAGVPRSVRGYLTGSLRVGSRCGGPAVAGRARRWPGHPPARPTSETSAGSAGSGRSSAAVVHGALPRVLNRREAAGVDALSEPTARMSCRAVVDDLRGLSGTVSSTPPAVLLGADEEGGRRSWQSEGRPAAERASSSRSPRSGIRPGRSARASRWRCRPGRSARRPDPPDRPATCPTTGASEENRAGSAGSDGAVVVAPDRPLHRAAVGEH